MAKTHPTMDAAAALKSLRQASLSESMQAARASFMQMPEAERWELVFLMVIGTNNAIKRLAEAEGYEFEENRPARMDG